MSEILSTHTNPEAPNGEPGSSAPPDSGPFDVVMRFESEDARRNFCEWMCDGGGEWGLMDSFECHVPQVMPVEFRYHPENAEYPKNDRRRYGEFMGNLDEHGRPMIICSQNASEQQPEPQDRA